MRILASVIFISFVSSCASLQSIDLVANQTTEVATQDNDVININKIHVNQYSDGVYVKGRVSRDSDDRFSKGFVTIDLYNEQGVRIDSVDAAISFKRSGSKSLRIGTFAVQLEETPEKNSRVVVTPHDKRKPAKENDGSLELM